MDYTPVSIPGDSLSPLKPRPRYTGFPGFLLAVLILRMLTLFTSLIPTLLSFTQMGSYQNILSIMGVRLVQAVPLIVMLVGTCLHKKGAQWLLGAGMIAEVLISLITAMVSMSGSTPESMKVRLVLPVLEAIPILLFSLFVALYYILKSRGISKAVKNVFCALCLIFKVISWVLTLALEVGLSVGFSTATAAWAVQNVIFSLISTAVAIMFYIALICYSPFNKPE